ncbi:hypothetical protein [Hyalangium rubrum]|uniref:Uncharacterized protein n=1 Tax=Hyalangium rubrum TaxID=3103134 RepID=A0ABU5GZB4_9BACT|nr:hypothetical protein [Hyalangium sp. s54d21]MDY7226519.1 hypothetical protein [Hyalangium sp. s54d21]
MNKIILPADELNEFDLPPVCVVTGQTENVEFKDVKFAWYPRWVAVFILINLLIAAIIATALTKRVKGKLPFTEEAFKAWKQGQVFFALSIVAAIGLFIGGIFLFLSENEVLGGAAWLLCLAVPITVNFKFVRNKGPVVERIADGQITLKLPSQDAIRMFKEHLVAGRQSLPSAAGALKKSA